MEENKKSPVLQGAKLAVGKTKAELEDEKLELEIENLRKKNRWEFYLPFFQLATIIGAMIGFVIGFVQFESGQQKERDTREREQTIRLQSQIRTDEEEILKFAQDKNQTLSRVSFLFGDLNSAMAPEIRSKQIGPSEFQDYRRPFTESLVSLITRDLDVSNSARDISFPAVALAHWDDYTVYLRENPDVLRVILEAYVSALRHLDEANPSYLQELRFFAPTKQYVYMPKYEQQEREKHLFQHFKDIRNGFKGHLKLAADDPRPDVKAIGEQNVRAFELGLCNDAIAEQILGVDPARKPCERR